MNAPKDRTGQRFGRLVAVERVASTRHGNTRWLCRCDCGGEKVVAVGSLRRGDTRSCGCLAKDRRRAQREAAAGSAAERLWSYVTPEPNTGCWLWAGALDDKGYGRLTVKRKTKRAHRLAWQSIHGPIPRGMNVLHKCDNPACVNAHSHLFLGTQAENMADMRAKGRSGHCGRRLSLEKAAEVRARHAAEGMPYSSLAEEYGVNLSTIGRIIRRAA
jgi:hypothetical protein